MADAGVFTVGGTVQAGGGLYIPRRADDELLELCRDATFAYVLTPRQMGKSSLMVRTAERLESEGVRSVIIDLSQIGVKVTPQEWHLGLLTAVEDRLELESDVFDWWSEHEHLGMTQRLTLFFEEVVLAEVASPVVVFVDEIDTTLSIPFTDDFYAAIRYMHNARSTTPVFKRLSFVLIGVAMPGDLIGDRKRTPFNIGRRVDLTDFTFDEARPLADGLGRPAEEAERALRWMLAWTGGHPYLTQRLGQVIGGEDRGRLTEAIVEDLVAGTFFEERSEQDNNLQFVRDMLTKRATDTLAVLETYREIRRGKRPVSDEEQSEIKNHLKLSGVVERRDGNLELRNRIYAIVFDLDWIKKRWPVPWIQRIPPAGWGLIAALVIAMVASVLFARAQLQLAVAEKKLTLQTVMSLEKQTTLTSRAEEARVAAEASAKSAEEQRDEAELQRQLAEEQAARAQVAEGRAKAALAQAQQAQAEAESARSDAEAQRERAESEFRKNTSRRLVIQAQSRLDKELDLALLLSVEAVRIDDNADTRSNLQTIVESVPHLEAILHTGDFEREVFLQPLAFSPTRPLLASEGPNGTVLLWDLTTRQLEGRPLQRKGSGGLFSLAFSPDGSLLAIVGEEVPIELWDVEARKLVGKPINGPWETTVRAAFSPDGKQLAVSGVRQKGLGFVGIWDVVTHELVGDLLSFPWQVAMSLSYSPDGRFLAAGGGYEDASQAGGAVTWNLATREPGATLSVPDGVVWDLVISNDSSFLIATTLTFDEEDNSTAEVLSWELSTHESPTRLLAIQDGGVLSVALSPDGTMAYGGFLGNEEQGMRAAIGLSGPGLGDLKLELPSGYGAVSDVRFSPDGRLLASLSETGTIALWDMNNLTSDRSNESAETRACRIANRNLTPKEWESLIGPDSAYWQTCPDLGSKPEEESRGSDQDSVDDSELPQVETCGYLR